MLGAVVVSLFLFAIVGVVLWYVGRGYRKERNILAVRSDSLYKRSLRAFTQPNSERAANLLQTQDFAINELANDQGSAPVEDVRIIYYKRSNDSDVLASALESLGYDVSTHRGGLSSIPVNVLRYGRSVPARAV